MSRRQKTSTTDIELFETDELFRELASRFDGCILLSVRNRTGHIAHYGIEWCGLERLNLVGLLKYGNAKADNMIADITSDPDVNGPDVEE